jgi:hypothetical protein
MGANKGSGQISDIHYSIRVSERDLPIISISNIVRSGVELEKRRKFKPLHSNVRAFLYEDAVYLLNKALNKRITVLPYSRRKWKLLGT